MDEELMRLEATKTRLRIQENTLMLAEIRDYLWFILLFVSGGIVHYFYNDWINTTATVVVVMYLVWLSQDYRREKWDKVTGSLPDDLL